MPSKPVLYYADWSPVARSVALTAAAIGIELELIHLDLFAGDQFKSGYLKVMFN